MKNSKFVIDRLARLFEQGLISSKDLVNEIMIILIFRDMLYFLELLLVI